VALIVATPGVLAAYPRPAGVPYRWQLEFEPGPLRLYVDDVEGRSYWYFTYMVTNKTRQDHIWAPELTLFTDTGEIMRSGRDVPSRVTEDIMALLGNELLENQNEIIGDLFQGVENAREGLAVWPARRLDVNEMTLFVRGISGESARVANPVSGDMTTLYKTLQIDYLVPGNASARGSRAARVIDERWVMR
jgi:hypothetical protein